MWKNFVKWAKQALLYINERIECLEVYKEVEMYQKWEKW